MKWMTKTCTESLPTPAAARKVPREVEEFRDFLQLSREILPTNAKICQLQPV